LPKGRMLPPRAVVRLLPDELGRLTGLWRKGLSKGAPANTLMSSRALHMMSTSSRCFHLQVRKVHPLPLPWQWSRILTPLDVLAHTLLMQSCCNGRQCREAVALTGEGHVLWPQGGLLSSRAASVDELGPRTPFGRRGASKGSPVSTFRTSRVPRVTSTMSQIRCRLVKEVQRDPFRRPSRFKILTAQGA